jgi:cytochrome c peroxidase
MKYDRLTWPQKFFALSSRLKYSRHVRAILLSSTLLLSCTDYEHPADEQIRLLKLQSLPEVSYSTANPYSEAKIKLGKLLFYDPILSGEKNISCATCHHPSLAYADGIDLSIGAGGIGLGELRTSAAGRTTMIRNSPTLVNTAFNGLTNTKQDLAQILPPMTWTAIRRTLEAQTFGPIQNSVIMRGNALDASTVLDSIAKRVRSIQEYVTLFNDAFGSSENNVTTENLGKAIAAFEQSLISNNSAYDRYVGGELEALTLSQKNGMVLFFGKANCATCHSGPMFSDFSLYNLGVADNEKLASPDLGASGKRLFRTPSLRNVSLTAPYMHNGTINTLKDVLEFYNTGSGGNTNDISIKKRPLHLTVDEQRDLLSFLETLTDENYDKEVPTQVPSGLKPVGN